MIMENKELKKIDAYFRAANYLSAAQLYLLDNPLLRRKLSLKDIKPKRKLILNHKGMDYVLCDEKLQDKKQQAISLLNQGMSYVQVGKKFKVSDNAIRKWVKSLGLDPKRYGRNGKEK